MPAREESPLAFALLVVSEPNVTHVHRLSGEPWQKVGVGGIGVLWSAAAARLFVVGTRLVYTEEMTWGGPTTVVVKRAHLCVHALRAARLGEAH